jgi:anti-sigma B factor antagonist
MKIVVTEKNGISVIAISGKILGGPDTGELDEKLYTFLAKGVNKACIDLAQCEWINASGLSILTHHYKKFRDAGGELVLACLKDKIERVLIISRLTEVFRTFDSVEKAVDDFTGKAAKAET